MLAIAIITITSALVFYTAAVFWEKKTGILRGRHLLLFRLGALAYSLSLRRDLWDGFCTVTVSG